METDLGFRLLKRDYTIKESWLVDAYRDIKEGKISLSDAAKRVRIRHNVLCCDFIVELSTKTLSDAFKEAGKPLFYRGRKGIGNNRIMNPFLISKVKETQEEIKSGITKTWIRLRKEGVSISRATVEDIMQNHLGFPKRLKKPKACGRTRYVVSQVNGCWHGDIHYVILKKNTKKTGNEVFICAH